jgi:replicative DNA helicase
VGSLDYSERQGVRDGIAALVGVAGALRGEVRDAITDELRWNRTTRIPSMPLPSDLEAEAQLINRILNGCPLSKTHPLNGDDFYSPLHRVVFEAAWAIEETGNAVTTERVLVLMRLQEMPVTQSVCDDVNWLLTDGSLESLASLVGRVLEFARRRRMIGWLQTLEQELRLGSASVASTKSRIAEMLAKSSPQQSSPVASVSKITTKAAG